jgi:signal transduction histidine kinase
MKTAIPFLKPYAAWATDLTDKYRSDSLFKAAVHIVSIIGLLGVFLLGVTGWGIMHVSSDTMLYVSLSMIALLIVFGYLIIHYSLAPAKNSILFQKRFIGNVAHELRTPLAIIKTSTEVALIDPKITTAQSETMHDILGELDRISQTINNLLSFDTLIQPSQMKLESVDLGKIAEMVMARHQALAESRGITLSLSMGSNRVVMGNPIALEQVATNLVKNAINYTPENTDGTVRISIESDYRGRIVLAIIDSGIGIGQKDLYHIFEPYYRGDTSRARGIGTGTSGLGLAIVNEIVRIHKGTISVKSAIGLGTTIAISLPPSTEPALGTPFSQDGSADHDVHEVSIDFS